MRVASGDYVLLYIDMGSAWPFDLWRYQWDAGGFAFRTQNASEEMVGRRLKKKGGL